jgi:hypothetical protein
VVYSDSGNFVVGYMVTSFGIPSTSCSANSLEEALKTETFAFVGSDLAELTTVNSSWL